MVVFNRCAVVTGSNKGIGFEIVKELCKTFDGDVFLTGIHDCSFGPSCLI